MTPAVASLPELVPRSNDNKAHPPAWKEDILDLMLLKDLSDSEKHTLLQNSGYMFGIRTDSIDGPRRATRQVAKRKPGSMPCVQVVDTTATEVIPAKNKRDAKYAHEGWSTLAVSGIPHWAFLRETSGHIGVVNQEGDWITKRFMGQRLAFDLLTQDLEPGPEFEADIKAALMKSTKFDKIQALYRVFNAWGDVIPLEFDVGFSLTVTDLEANFPLSADDGPFSPHQLLKVNNTTRIIKQQGGDPNLSVSDVGQWIGRKVAVAQWSLIRIRRVVPTIGLLNEDLQEQIEALKTHILSFIPASMTRTVENHLSVADDPKTVRPAASITIYSGRRVDSLTLTYVNGAPSNRHGAQGGAEHKFPLDSGEHITEVIVWSGSEDDTEVVYGIQFITSKGRISNHYGGSAGRPTVLRSENGVLVGLHSMTRKYSTWKALSKLQAIWRHDVLNSVPRQSDVFSDYIGGNNGTPFNGRAVVGNSKSMRISKIEISWGSLVDNLQLTYVDGERNSAASCATAYHGGIPWSNGFKSTFNLETGEHIVTISGRHNNETIVQLCFATNLGRTSDVFGGGTGQSFSQKAPLDANGKSMRLQYMCGKSEKYLNGVMFAWTPV